MIFAQGFKDSDSALLEQGKSAVKEYLQGQILLLEDAKDMTENIRNILEDMLIMIEEY
jgi:predicted transcriptional regulator